MKYLLTVALIIWGRTRTTPPPSPPAPVDRFNAYEFDGYNEIGAMG